MPETQCASDQMPLIAPVTIVEIQKRLARWYHKYQRDLPWRRTCDPYAVWVSEVMLQQTQVKTVVPYYVRFLERFPDVARLARADEQAVLKLWEGLGYYSRARNLHRAAQLIVKDFDGSLPRQWEEIRRLPGVGDYIAAAVLSIAFSKPYAVVDGNVKRVLARLFMIATPVNQPGGHKHFQQAADHLLDSASPSLHNQALMELGALICTPKQPLCDQCPLSALCRALTSQVTDRYPYRIEQRAVGSQHWIAAVVIKSDRLLLVQRPNKGLLAGLWEFPTVAIEKGDDPFAKCIALMNETAGLEVAVQDHIVTVRHAYTHFKLQLDLYFCTFIKGRVRLKGQDAFQWVRLSQLHEFPLHKAVHKGLPALRRMMGG